MSVSSTALPAAAASSTPPPSQSNSASVVSAITVAPVTIDSSSSSSSVTSSSSNVINTTASQLVKNKDFISNKPGNDLIKIKVATNIKTSYNDNKSLVINTEPRPDSLDDVLSVPKINNGPSFKSKIMTSTGGIQIFGLTQSQTSNNSNPTTASMLSNINQATTPTMLTLTGPKNLFISSSPSSQSNPITTTINANASTNSFVLSQSLKINTTNNSSSLNQNSQSMPINVQSGTTATILNVLNDLPPNNGGTSIISNNTAPPVIKAISLNPSNFIPIQQNSATAATPTSSGLLERSKINSTLKTATASGLSNSSNSTLSINKPTILSGSSTNNNTTLNNLVKNLINTNTNSPATANAVAAVAEAAKYYVQMNSTEPTPITTTTVTLSNNTNTLNSITSNGSKILSTIVPNNNSIEFSENNNNNSSLNHKINVPSISSTSKIVLNNNMNVTKTSAPPILSFSSTESSASKQIGLKPTATNNATNHHHNGAISNINIKPLSPVHFQLQDHNSTSAKTRTIITTTSNNNTSLNSSTTPPPAPLTLNNGTSMLFNSSNISNITNFIKANNSTGSIVSIPTNLNTLNSSIYKTISHPTQQQFLSNIVNLTNSNQQSSSQTIAQICSNLGQPHVLHNPGNSNSPSPISIIQPIRYISNHQSNNTNIQANRNHTHHVNMNTNTTTNSNNTIQNQYLNQMPFNLTHPQVTAASVSGQNAVNVLNSNLTSASSVSNSSPSSSPLKPNIIRKPRRDSPSSSNNNPINNEHSFPITAKDIKHPNFELNSQDTSGSKIISLSALPTAFLTAVGNQQTTSQITTVNLTNRSDTQPQVLAYASSSSPATSSAFSSSSSSSTSSKPVISLNTDSGNDLTKNIRKFTLSTHQQQYQQPICSLATSSSSASSSASSTNSSNNNIQYPASSSSSSISESLTQSNDKDKMETASLKEDFLNPNTKRKRKQEFRKPANEEPVTLGNRYLNENTNISNNHVISQQQQQQHQQQKKTNSKINKLLSKNDLIIKHSRYFDDTETDIHDEASSFEDDEHQPPNSKQSKLNSNDSTAKHKISNYNSKRKINSTESMSEINIRPDSHINNVKIEEKNLCNAEVTNSESGQTQEEDTSDSSCLDDETVQLLSKEFSYVASNGVKWVTKKRAQKVQSQLSEWNSRKHHFIRYSDINPENNQNENSINSNTITQQELIENLNEWKFHFVISQVKTLITYENESLDVINEVENLMQNSNFLDYSDVCLKINESIKANSQRHKFVNEQLDEAQIMIHKLFDSKEKFKSLVLLSQSSPATDINASASYSSRSHTDSNSNQKLSNSKLTNKTSPHGLKKSFKKNINTRSSNSAATSTLVTTNHHSHHIHHHNHVKSFKQSNKTANN